MLAALIYQSASANAPLAISKAQNDGMKEKRGKVKVQLASSFAR